MSPMTPSHVQMLSRIAAGEVCAIPVETHPPSLIIAGKHSASEYSQRINALIRTVFMISGLSRAVAAGQTGGGRENVGEVDECSGNSHLRLFAVANVSKLMHQSDLDACAFSSNFQPKVKNPTKKPRKVILILGKVRGKS